MIESQNEGKIKVKKKERKKEADEERERERDRGSTNNKLAVHMFPDVLLLFFYISFSLLPLQESMTLYFEVHVKPKSWELRAILLMNGFILGESSCKAHKTG